MKQICRILWVFYFEFIGIYQVHLIVKIMIADWQGIIDIGILGGQG
jgi:hypothetical protein